MLGLELRPLGLSERELGKLDSYFVLSSRLKSFSAARASAAVRFRIVFRACDDQRTYLHRMRGRNPKT